MRAATLAALLVLLAGAAVSSGGTATHAATCWSCGDYTPAWSPDGRTIAFVRYVQGASGPRATIWTVAAHGGTAHVLVGLNAVYPRSPTGPVGPFAGLNWSPDSRAIAISSAGAVWTVRAAGGTTHLSGVGPSWSPDSRQLAVGTQLDIGSFRNQQLVPGEVWIVAADGSASRVLAGTDPSLGGGRWASDPLWSATDDIAYLTGARPPGSKMPDTGGGEIWASQPDGARAHKLADAAGYRPFAWSRDGQTLYVISVRFDGSYLAAVDRTGGALRPVESFGTFDTCCWLSPDGSRLALARGSLVEPYTSDLEVVELPSGSSRTLLRFDHETWAAWSPAGDRIAFSVGGECGPLTGIETISPKGGPATRLTHRCRRDGTARRDVMRGGPGPDALHGHAGSDLLVGNGGPDFLQGGQGKDDIHGGAGNDRLYGGPGRDRVFGDGGNDTVNVRDGAADIVRCGTGRDTVHADPADPVARDCELLDRR